MLSLLRYYLIFPGKVAALEIGIPISSGHSNKNRIPQKFHWGGWGPNELIKPLRKELLWRHTKAINNF